MGVALLTLSLTSSLILPKTIVPVAAFTVSTTRTLTSSQLNGNNINMMGKMDNNYLSSQLFSSPNNNNEEDIFEQQEQVKTFDQAGASLIEAEDKEKLLGMGDFDSNPEVSS